MFGYVFLTFFSSNNNLLLKYYKIDHLKKITLAKESSKHKKLKKLKKNKIK